MLPYSSGAQKREDPIYGSFANTDRQTKAEGWAVISKSVYILSNTHAKHLKWIGLFFIRELSLLGSFSFQFGGSSAVSWYNVLTIDTNVRNRCFYYFVTRKRVRYLDITINKEEMKMLQRSFKGHKLCKRSLITFDSTALPLSQVR